MTVEVAGVPPQSMRDASVERFDVARQSRADESVDDDASQLGEGPHPVRTHPETREAQARLRTFFHRCFWGG